MIEKMLIGYCRVVQSLIRGIGRSVAYLLPILASVVAYEVFARYALDRPTIWGYDTSLFSIWLYFSTGWRVCTAKRRPYQCRYYPR